MTALLACALLLASTGAERLSEARAAFDAGEYRRSEALALEVAKESSGGGDAFATKALYLAGLARFRDGRPGEALDALDRAGPGAAEPGAFEYNRGACLEALGRSEEAERAFLEAAAADRGLAPVALVNAAYAALDRRALRLARERGKSAREALSTLPSPLPAAVALVDEFDRAVTAAEEERAATVYKQGLDAFDKGHYAEARERFTSAAAIAPTDGRIRLMAGAAALRAGATEDAQVEFQRALETGLSPAEASIAKTYIEEVAAAAHRNFGVSGSFEVGYDSNALQSGPESPERFAVSGASLGSAFSFIGLSLVARAAPRPDLDLGAKVSAVQLAYAEPGAQDYSLQEHLLTLSAAFTPAERVLLGAALEGEMSFTGLEDFRPMQHGEGARAWVTLSEAEVTRTRLDVGVSYRAATRGEFAYLTGTRWGASISQEVHTGIFVGRAGYLLEVADLGNEIESEPPSPNCGPPPCSATLIEPYGHTSNAPWLEIALGPWHRLVLDVYGEADWRVYHDQDEYILGPVPEGQAPPELILPRRDLRLVGTATLSLDLGRGWLLVLRGEAVSNLSTIHGGWIQNTPNANCNSSPFPCPAVPDHTYEKRVVSLGTSFSW